MNFTQSIATLILSGIVLTGCKETGSAPNTEENKAVVTTEKQAVNPEKLETASFTIEGMTCSVGCAKTIEKELSALEGVQKASVDFDKKTATVEFDSDQQTPETLAKIVEAAADGKTYKVSNVKASGNHAMLLDQEKEKKAEPTAKTKKGAKEAKPACCSAKKAHCSADEKKA